MSWYLPLFGNTGFLHLRCETISFPEHNEKCCRKKTCKSHRNMFLSKDAPKSLIKWFSLNNQDPDRSFAKHWMRLHPPVCCLYMRFLESLFFAATLRIIAQCNGGVNEPVFFQGCFCRGQNGVIFEGNIRKNMFLRDTPLELLMSGDFWKAGCLWGANFFPMLAWRAPHNLQLLRFRCTSNCHRWAVWDQIEPTQEK